MSTPSLPSSRRGWGPWWGLLLAIAGALLGTTAGFWQLGRGAEKRALEARFAAGGAGPALQQLVSDGEAASLRYTVLRVTGHYDPGHQVLLDNMSDAGRPGYQVLTPFATAAGTVLVNRGWVPADGDRTRLPDIGVDGASRELVGRIEHLPRPGIRLAAADVPANAPWPRRLLFPTSAEVSAQLGAPLRDFQLLLDAGEPDGFVRDWRPGGMLAERHVAYAVQWFGLALTVVVIYVVLVIRTHRKQTS
ncbi:MAG: SURF1 family protein [Gammaproteobacteria bacterium]